MTVFDGKTITCDASENFLPVTATLTLSKEERSLQA